MTDNMHTDETYELAKRLFEEHSYFKAYEILIALPLRYDLETRAMFSAMGTIFKLKTEKGLGDYSKEAFRCFEAAYAIIMERQKTEIDTINDSIATYDMAYAYLEGFGTLRDAEKGLVILRDIDKMFRDSGGSIADADDDFGIIEKYWVPES
jgi:hypothetical protein